MNVRLQTILLAAIAFLIPAGAATQHKYDVKSGIITFENNIAILGKAAPQRQILYFDDYGRLERKELYEGEALREAYLCDGKELFNVVYEESTAYRAGPSVLGTEARFEGDTLSAPKKGVTVRKLTPMKVAGKLCSAYQITQEGVPATLAGWGHITLYTANDAGGIHTVSKAVKMDLDARIPPGMFSVPAHFKVK